jgi:hypothetical protein
LISFWAADRFSRWYAVYAAKWISKRVAVTVDLSGLMGRGRKLADDFDVALTDQNQ